MTVDPAEAGPAPPAVLLMPAGKPAEALTRALVAAGFTVDAACDARELAASTLRRSYDAVVLHRGAGKVELAGMVETIGEALGQAPHRPLVIVVGAQGGKSPHVVDLHVAAGDAAAAAREILGAVSARRLVIAQEEIERLRATVLFARQTAHDLAQPLTTILARAQLLRLSAKPEDPHHRAVNIICDEADRLAKMMEEFQKLKVMSQSPGSQKGSASGS